MLRPFVQTAVCVLAGLALLLSACAPPGVDDPDARRSTAPSPPAGVARVAVGPVGSHPEIAVTSVVPWPGESPWTGATVILDYSRLGGDVDLRRSWLHVDGRFRPSRVTWTALTPVSFVVVFTWRWPVRPGTHTFHARLGTTGGGFVAYEWTTTAR
jgi:hypothetical protein